MLLRRGFAPQARRLRASLAWILTPLLLVGCAQTEQARSLEGQVFLRAGMAGEGMGPAEVTGGPPLRRLGILTPGFQLEWQAAWIEGDRKLSGAEGATTGFFTGLVILQSTPILFLTWPVAVGVVAGSTALGAFGQHADSAPFSHVTSEDRAALLTVAANLHPDRLLREAMAKALTDRTAQPPIPIPWHPTWGPDTLGTDPLADARKQGADGVLDLGVEAFGLAAGEDEETVGVFIRIRARILESTGGGLRYERILEYGPNQRVPGLPPAATHSVEFLVVDQGRVFQQEVRETIERTTRVLAEDPALPLVPR
jgi:hypothetical protein